MMRSLLIRLARRLPPVVLEEPWSLFIMLGCIMSGLSYLLAPSAGSIALLLPDPIVWLWYGDLLLGGTLGLIGLLRGRWNIQIAGLLPLGASATVYAIAIAVVAGLRGIVPTILIAMFAAAAFAEALGLYAASTAVRARVDDAT